MSESDFSPETTARLRSGAGYLGDAIERGDLDDTHDAVLALCGELDLMVVPPEDMDSYMDAVGVPEEARDKYKKAAGTPSDLALLTARVKKLERRDTSTNQPNGTNVKSPFTYWDFKSTGTRPRDGEDSAPTLREAPPEEDEVAKLRARVEALESQICVFAIALGRQAKPPPK